MINSSPVPCTPDYELGCPILPSETQWKTHTHVYQTAGRPLKNPESLWGEHSNISYWKNVSLKNLFPFLLDLFANEFHHLLYYFFMFVFKFKESVKNSVLFEKCHKRFSFCCIFCTICPWLKVFKYKWS